MSTISRIPFLAAALAAVYIVFVPMLTIGAAAMVTQAAGVGYVLSCGDTAPAVADGPGGPTQQIGNEQWSAEQLANAQIIVNVAVQRELPRRAAVVAVAAAIVEAKLQNLSYGDRDSLGLFQQRPSQGWGSPAEILNPTYAAGKFYDHLVRVPGWATMPPGQAEQEVQRSGFPERYGPREPAAAAIVAKYWQGPDNPTPPSTGQTTGQIDLTFGGCPDTGGSNLSLDPAQLPEGFQPPSDPVINAAVTYALRQVGKPYRWGGTGPDAFDCSGLMQAAWAHAGVGISRSTLAQRHDGVAIGSVGQARPGDLLFIPGAFGTPRIPRHVGMYAGEGVIVNAYDSRTGVILESLDSWASNIVAIRRIVITPGGTPPTGDPRL